MGIKHITVSTQIVLFIAILIDYLVLAFSGIPNIASYAPAIGTIIGVLIVFFHGVYSVGYRDLAVLLGITVVVSASMEILSLKTGFPFGFYVYDNIPGLRIGGYPILISGAYFAVVYTAYMLALLFLGSMKQLLRKGLCLYLPFLATLLVITFDLLMDPVMVNLFSAWNWHEEGIFFGIPFTNYLGWFITVYIILQWFTYYLIKNSASSFQKIYTHQDTISWFLVVTGYFFHGLPFFLISFGFLGFDWLLEPIRTMFLYIYVPISLFGYWTIFSHWRAQTKILNTNNKEH